MIKLTHLVTHPSYDLVVTKPNFEIKTKNPQLELTSSAPKIMIKQPPGHLMIDQSPCRASLGFKDNQSMALDIARQGKEQAIMTIGKIAEEGTRLSRIEEGGDPIADMAFESTLDPETDLEIMPIDPPIISYEPAPPQISATAGNINSHFTPGEINYSFTRGTVSLVTKQYGDLHFSAVDVKI